MHPGLWRASQVGRPRQSVFATGFAALDEALPGGGWPASALTELLLQKAGRVVGKDSIVARLSSWEADFSENSVEVYVHRLRKRFADLGVVIKTVRGFGYVIECDVAVGPAAGADD